MNWKKTLKISGLVVSVLVLLGVVIWAICAYPTSDTKAAAPSAEVVALQKQCEALAKQNENLQKLVAETSAAAKQASDAANRAITMASKVPAAVQTAQTVQTVQSPAQQVNPAVQQVLGQVGGNNDMTLQMRTGRPAIIHELEQAEMRRQDRQNHLRVEITPSVPRYTRFDLEQAQEKEFQLKDLAKDLRGKIRDAEEDISGKKHYAETQPHLDIRAWARKRVIEIQEDLEELKTKLTKTEASLHIATAETAKISRGVR